MAPVAAASELVLQVSLGQNSYASGDVVVAFVSLEAPRDGPPEAIVKELSVMCTGIERLDPGWLTAPPGAAVGPKGERAMFCVGAVGLEGDRLAAGTRRTVRMELPLPRGLPPSYRGTAVRYTYTLVACAIGGATESVVAEVRLPVRLSVPCVGPTFFDWESSARDSPPPAPSRLWDCRGPGEGAGEPLPCRATVSAGAAPVAMGASPAPGPGGVTSPWSVVDPSPPADGGGGRTYSVRVGDSPVPLLRVVLTGSPGETTPGGTVEAAMDLDPPVAPGAGHVGPGDVPHLASWRCLEVTLALEECESHPPRLARPRPRRPPGSPLVRVVAETSQVTADLLSTALVVGVPPSAAPSFSTPAVSVSWRLVFEFVASRVLGDAGRMGGKAAPVHMERLKWVLPLVMGRADV